MLTYVLVVLSTNLGIVMMHVVGSTYHRSLSIMSHLLIGRGQHALLRIVLGIIEVVSTLFRSFSLSLRLCCNAAAGHVLLAVLVDMTLSSSTMDRSHSSLVHLEIHTGPRRQDT